MGTVAPEPGFLAGLRTLCNREGIVLIFDEVMTGFRLAPGGAQAIYGVRPDLTCLGKIIGGGLPVAAYGGRADLMDRVSPAGPIYQAGTLSGNPLAMVAGLWSLARLKPALYKKLAAMTQTLAAGLADAAREAGVAVQVNAVGSMITPFFTNTRVRDFDTAVTSDTAAFGRFFRSMLEGGIYLPPSQFEAWFCLGRTHHEGYREDHCDRTHRNARGGTAFEQVGGQAEAWPHNCVWCLVVGPGF